MAELGPDSQRFHEEIGELAGNLGIDMLITVGEAALPIAKGFATGERHAVATPEEAGALLEELGREGDRVLVKGSRSAGLEKVLAAAPAARPAVEGSDGRRRDRGALG
jgi:UDP-N-acetylmuramoyl-tripeptide--D-alanyl-D-alanine ligase